MRRNIYFAAVFAVCGFAVMTFLKAEDPAAAPAQEAGDSGSGEPALETVSGKVAETMDSGSYTYIRVVRGKDSAWVATFKQAVKVGDEVSFAGGVVMNDFHSKRLKRTFKKIIFSDGPAAGGSASLDNSFAGPRPFEALAKKDGSLCPDEKSPPAAPAGAAPAANAPAHGTAAAPVPTAGSARAEGPDAFTVAEVFGRRAELAGKTVAVRGKVVKISRGIMGRNWVHLQDGSGDAKAATHDLLATTSGEARVGETVTARGTVVKDKDFGSGYSYVVLLEKTAFKR